MIYNNENIFNEKWKNDIISEGNLIEKIMETTLKKKLKKVKKWKRNNEL